MEKIETGKGPGKYHEPWKYYDQTACGYDELHGQEQRAKVKAIISLIKPRKDWKVLDVGCGTGVSMEGWPCKIVGIEPSQEMAKIALEKGLDVAVAPAEKIPFPDDSFDLAICVTCAHHFDSSAFCEIARVARRAVFTILEKGGAKRVEVAISKEFNVDRRENIHPDILLICSKK